MDEIKKNQKKIKNIDFENIFIFIICTIFMIIAVLLTRNEVFLDDWYIEGSADGLFGDNNRSLLVVGTNYIITFIIYLLSLTKIRLFWFHILFVLMNFISNILVLKVIMNKCKQNFKYILCIGYLIIITPLVGFYIQFTTTAAYVVATGCLWIFYSIENQKRIRNYVFATIWILLGTSVRFDCIYFSIFFMGIVWICKIINDYKLYSSSHYWKRLFKVYFLPFIIPLVVASGIELSQRILLENAHPGFREWNQTRAHVDDYSIPDYVTNSEKYQEIGISYNDFQLLKSWNNIDPDFFTEEKYEEILSIKEEENKNNISEEGIISLIIRNCKIMSENIIFWIALGIIFLFYFSKRKVLLYEEIVLLLAGIFLSSCFFLTGRLIWRTEWPIWTVFIVASVALYFEKKDNLIVEKDNKNNIILAMLLLIGFSIVKPVANDTKTWDPYKGNSVIRIYYDRYKNPDNYGRYLGAKLFGKDTMQYDTMDGEISECLEDNKEILYYRLWTRSWLQQYPLTDRDIFRTAPISAGENWGTLGQYFINLGPMKEIYEKYDVSNPIKDLVKENIRVVVKDIEFVDRCRELNQYLKEHYYEDVHFSVEEIIENAIVVQYIRNFDLEKMTEAAGTFSVDFQKHSNYEGISQLTIKDYNIELYDPETDKGYLQLTDSVGNKSTFTLMKNSTYETLNALIDKECLLENETYLVTVFFEHDGVWYKSQNSDSFENDIISSQNFVENLDYLHTNVVPSSSMDGFYEQEKDFAWIGQYCELKLYNSQIKTKGIQLILEVPEYTIKNTLPIKVYVNGVCAAQIAPNSGKYNVLIDPNVIAAKENRYHIEIECPYIYNPALDAQEADNRNLSLKVYYIGNPI